ncbi:biotrophy-associated secreted protein 2 [Apiospora saccharicola]|uniref:Biotrophy-associated secreted protein 2 n=1 Tax=Apiospora saccharicola TaxID=335842 RepID=A0ABR1TMX5_9PEZI
MVRISIAATMAFAITAFAMPNDPLNGLAARQAAGSANVGKGDGSQFITGQCASDADCASKCCAGPKGACAAEAVANENGKNGCGFTSAAAGAGGASSKSSTSSAAASASSAAAGSKNKVGGAAASSAAVSSQAASPASSAAAAASSAAAGGASKDKAGAAAADSSKPGSQNVGKADGSQFITGQCTSDADCASGCCAKPKGVCSAQAVSNVDGKQGCGFTKA